MYETYKAYIGSRGSNQHERNVNLSKDDLRRTAVNSPDYHADAKRNGVIQPMLFTRSGDDHYYNVICMPDDELWAGDIIDAFGEKYLVMEARADSTTHKTGKMMECNHLFKFQNFDSTVIGRWGIIDQSGYSSTVKGSVGIQTSEEQIAIYLPYDEDTAKIFVDKRIASHVGYDKTGAKILNSYIITSCSPNSRSFNTKDHLLMLKAVRGVYSASSDNIELGICDYISPAPVLNSPIKQDLKCEIVGKNVIMLGRSRTYSAVFYKSDGTTVDTSIVPVWSYDSIDGVTFIESDGKIKVLAANVDALIGEMVNITLSDRFGSYDPVTLSVGVSNIV